MPHLDSVIIHNFKSFKHVNIKFSDGFNCIVGANGSGKSNICDSLLFALGESSLKRMRVPNTAQLINSFAKPKSEDGVRKAYVKINFTGTEPLEVARIIKSNNKIGYRLNGKRVTRQEVVDALRGNKSEINETNIIAQGEISYMVNLNPKERRELIDVAAGIKEFNDKKDAAMKELEKVEAKMNESQIMLNERKGFLAGLEKEKEDAEKYLQLTDSVKQITYTLLKGSEAQAEKDFESITDALKNLEQKKKAVTASIVEIDVMLEKLSKDKEVLVKELNERSAELSSTNKMLEEINKEIAVKETQSKSLKEKLTELDAQADQLKLEKKKLQEESAAGKKNADAARTELEGKMQQLNSKEASGEDASSAQIGKISQNQKRMDEIHVQADAMSKQYLQHKFEIESLEKTISENAKELAAKTDEYGTTHKEMRERRDTLNEAERETEELQNDASLIHSDIQKQQKELDRIYAESVNVREQIQILGGTTDKTNDFLKRSVQKGYYGRAYELCTYDEKYALAVSAAAMSRLSYLVVDSAEVADQSIKLLKAKQFGRASFIPIRDLVLRGKENSNGLDPLINHVQFDKKFERAFSYIFANTYLVKSIEEAKAIGFGKGRFVTLDGELVEQSGVISGGSAKQVQNLQMLGSRYKALESEKESIGSVLEVLNGELEGKRKEIAAKQTESVSAKIELRHLEASVGQLKNEMEAIKDKATDLDIRLKQLNSMHSESDSKYNALLDELKVLKDENERIYEMNGLASSKQKGKADRTEAEKLKALRLEVEQLKISIATLSKEEELKNARQGELDAQAKAKNEESKEARKKLAILDSELLELSKNLKEMRAKMGKSDANSQELLKKIQDHDTKIGKLSTDKGRHQLDLERSNSALLEQETRKVQLQTRISDIKAELLAYPNTEAIKGQTQKELESKREIAKSDIQRLGAVNLKAPEVYEEKKRDVEEANSKLAVLASEKDSIIAMINEIESKKLDIFNETLADVNQNFERLYSYIFEGSAHLQLDNPKDPFNSGLAISIKSPKNRNSSVEALSGGEKSLVIIMLVFAIQAHNPMSLYLFDEIDAALDKENSKKLSRLMKEMSKKSQLIVISHNDSLISAADTAIGVVHRSGESRVVGLQLTPAQSIGAK